MLPVQARLRLPAEFSLVFRRGRQVRRRTMAVHVLLGAAGDDRAARVGFVVSGKVGGSVVRHRVTRRLRHLAAAWLPELPPGSLVVVRATPTAANASGTALRRDLDSALRAVFAAPRTGVPSEDEDH